MEFAVLKKFGLKLCSVWSQSHRRRSEFESAGAVGIEMLKFEAKKGDFVKVWQKLGGGARAPPGSAAHESSSNHCSSNHMHTQKSTFLYWESRKVKLITKQLQQQYNYRLPWLRHVQSPAHAWPWNPIIPITKSRRLETWMKSLVRKFTFIFMNFTALHIQNKPCPSVMQFCP